MIFKKKSIVILLFITCFANLFAEDGIVEVEPYPPATNEPVVVPPDYEKAIADMINDKYLNRYAMEDCYLSSTQPIYYSDSIYIHRLQLLPYSIEMPYNNIVKSFIDSYAGRIRQVSNMVGLGEQYYFSIFEQALSKYDLPMEFKYLPIIESALNAKATSHAGAAGLWQFMIGTGKLYDLEVNSLVDERRDPIKSSDAAARYLRDLYAIYNDWHLVIAAYNCGPGNVARAIRKSGGKTGYWDIYPYLPRETRGYVPIFIAANYIMNNYQFHNVCPSTPMFSPVTDSVVITQRLHLQQVADVLKISIDELRFLNPQYKQDIIPGNIKPYVFVLPMVEIANFNASLDYILNYRCDLTERQIMVEPAQRAENTASASQNSKGAKYYKVRSGDSLGIIAKRNGTTTAKLKKLNGLKSNTIHAGQRLRVR
jgi:membrane-bound lytic murein transglycosylase D